MAWEIAHHERDADGTQHVCKLRWRKGKAVREYQLPTAVVLPPSGPGRGQAIAALKKMAKDLRQATPSPADDLTDVTDALNAGDG